MQSRPPLPEGAGAGFLLFRICSAVPLVDEGAELVGKFGQILVGAAPVVGNDLHQAAARLLQTAVSRRGRVCRIGRLGLRHDASATVRPASRS